MKIYPRIHEDFHKRPSDNILEKIGSADDHLDGLISLTKDFYGEVNHTIFDYVIRAVWLRGRLKYKDKEYRTMRRNGHWPDAAVGFFMASMVGHTGKFLLNSGIIIHLQSYFDDFFPEFRERNPFEEPEYYAFPYKNISFEHLIFVHKHHDRLTLLQWGDDHAMSIWDFANWATDQAYCYNEETGQDVYWLSRHDRLKNFPFLRVHVKKDHHGK